MKVERGEYEMFWVLEDGVYIGVCHKEVEAERLAEAYETGKAISYLDGKPNFERIPLEVYSPPEHFLVDVFICSSMTHRVYFRSVEGMPQHGYEWMFEHRESGDKEWFHWGGTWQPLNEEKNYWAVMRPMGWLHVELNLDFTARDVGGFGDGPYATRLRQKAFEVTPQPPRLRSLDDEWA